MTILDFRTSNPPGSNPDPLSGSPSAVPLDPVDQLEIVIEDERTRLLKADALLGCRQVGLDPEALEVQPDVYFPYVVEMARELVAESIRRLDFFRLRKLVHQSIYGGNPS